MWLSLFLSDARRHAVQLAARAFDLSLRMFLLRAGHLRQSFGEPATGTTQNGNRHLQVVLQGNRRGTGGRHLPLRFQKQFRLGEHARANYPRAVQPGGIQLPGLPRGAMMLDEGGGHPLAVLHVDARHPAPDTSLPVASPVCLRALAAGSLPAALPPTPGDATPKSRRGRSAAPTLPTSS
jgi:hypothetical protein